MISGSFRSTERPGYEGKVIRKAILETISNLISNGRKTKKRERFHSSIVNPFHTRLSFPHPQMQMKKRTLMHYTI